MIKTRLSGKNASKLYYCNEDENTNMHLVFAFENNFFYLVFLRFTFLSKTTNNSASRNNYLQSNKNLIFTPSACINILLRLIRLIALVIRSSYASPIL